QVQPRRNAAARESRLAACPRKQGAAPANPRQQETARLTVVLKGARRGRMESVQQPRQERLRGPPVRCRRSSAPPCRFGPSGGALRHPGRGAGLSPGRLSDSAASLSHIDSGRNRVLDDKKSLRIGQPTEEEDAAGLVLLDQEEERMVRPEDRL